MKFKYGTRRKAIEYEKDIAAQWKKNKTFEKSIKQRSADNSYVFYDGPPFITGTPHYGHLMISSIKDAVARYQTMQGKRVERGWGWDCHGLPAERYVQDKLGIANKKDIGTKISMSDFVRECREAMVQTGSEWNDTIDRLGRWVDMNDAYKTMDADYMESVWWAFKELYDKGKIYEGEKILVYCTNDATPISKSEVAMENSYQMDTDPSVYVKFQLKNDNPTEIYFVRHGQTDANLAQKNGDAIGEDDAPLNATGKKQAKEIAEKLRKECFDVILVSPYKRAVETAEIINKYHNLPIITDEGLRERDGGGIDEKTWHEAFDFDSKTKFDGESPEEFFKRVYKVIDDIKEKYAGKKVMIVSHGGTHHGFYAYFNKLAWEGNMRIDKMHTADYRKYTFHDISHVVDSPTYLLAWTTTPWTLVANVALAVNPKLEYSLVEHGGERFYIASKTIERVLTDEKHQPLDYKIISKIKGAELVGLGYEPLFANRGPQAHHILAADFVSSDEGTGIVHQAPAYGEDDYELCQKHGVPTVSLVDENGDYTEGPWQGQNIWAVNKEIARTLQQQGKALKIEYIRHEYPHCHRCGEKLMYRACPSWFMDIDGQKSEMLSENAKTRWVPAHVGEKRFNNVVETSPDWNLSRNRYWATPIPVWKGERADGTTVIKVIGSYDEFEKLTGQRLDDYHLPNIINTEFELDGVTMRHIGEVLDCWFESGAMPFAQFHYPFENKEKFEANFPADFITEAIDQTRGWFTSLLRVNVGLFGKAPWKNLICAGLINAADGKKMSKKLGNYTDPNILFDQYSVDAFRFYVLSSPLTNGEDFSFNDKGVADVARKLSMIWNVYDFFTMYADVDGWEFPDTASEDAPQKIPAIDVDGLENVLDRWIVSRVCELRDHVTKYMDEYNIPEAMNAILPFVDDLSNWFVRRSRRRFWKSEDDADKSGAYRTLYYVLCNLSLLLAPFTPFLAEELYHKLVGGESVHLLHLAASSEEINEEVLDDMKRAREIIERGLALRMEQNDGFGQIKVRQPLASLTYSGEKLDDFYEQIIAEEVNVKSVKQGNELTLNKKLTPALKREGQAREIIRVIQNARKDAGLNVDDRIVVNLTTSDRDLNQTIDEYRDVIAAEILATKFATNDGYQTTAKIDDAELNVQLKKAAK